MVVSFRRRLGVSSFDMLIALIPVWLITPLLVYISTANGPETDFVMEFVLRLNIFLAWVIYVIRPLFLSLVDRPGVGEKVTSTIVVCAEDPSRKAPRTRILLRQLVKGLWTGACLLLGLYPLIILDFLVALTNSNNRAGHDYLARTLVADRKAFEASSKKSADVDANLEDKSSENR